MRYRFSGRIISQRISGAVPFILRMALLITCIAVFVPFSPKMPWANHDMSWELGMNQALAQGLVIGKEIIFSFGPYASIFTKAFHPETDWVMILGGLFLAFSYWGYLVLLMKEGPWYGILIFGWVLAGGVYSRDALFLSMPLLAGVTCAKCLNFVPGMRIPDKQLPLVVAGMFAPFGLLVLIKGSFILWCGAALVLSASYFIHQGKRLLALTCLASPLGMMVLLWMGSGLHITGLLDYGVNTGSIISGYTEAMAVNGNKTEVVLFLAAAALLLGAILVPSQRPWPERLFLGCAFSIFLFISFKNGFVRHDGHALISGGAILMAGILLPFVLRSRLVFPVLVGSFISWGYITSQGVPGGLKAIPGKFGATYITAWNGYTNRVLSVNWPGQDFETALQDLQKQAAFPVLSGTCDIYSYSQAYLIASGNTWAPRPIFQSYSAYTVRLAELNKRHLLGEQAPDNIIFRMEPIDGRIPALEDGVSWPVLLAKYRPTMMTNNFLFLRKSTDVKNIQEPKGVSHAIYDFGQPVKVPPSDQPLFVEFKIKQTWRGRLAQFIYKPTQLQAVFELTDGTHKNYRLIAGMAQSGFVLSPFIETTAELGLLFEDSPDLARKRVKSFTIYPADGNNRHWNHTYEVTFRTLRLTKTT